MSKEQLVAVVEERSEEKLSTLLTDIFNISKERRGAQKICGDGIFNYIVTHLETLRGLKQENITRQIVYSIIKRPTLSSSLTCEEVVEIVKSGVWKENIDILRSLLRTEQQISCLVSFTIDIKNVLETIDLRSSSSASYVIAKLAPKYPATFEPFIYTIVDILCEDKELQNDSINAMGEALMALCMSSTEKIQIATKIDEKLVALRDSTKNVMVHSLSNDVVNALRQ
ncbi:hypothetical protein EIN_087380 [Entamoeba invadens IP1]|uniref:hypothetical protein n=1 Tax=Entamoeba invadens IP1 TaxID=370355 RepID=UPI0002C3CF1D|nr:hypothetical protein EIN_087380 [Entamoeba invadens IP1]ELP85426.1 hypothetical protein EIN_087380 [Entamoeba invadens IP1]|eukprot:XP_004184772.1 hypothetical protein EIN_087380 [Entamoeba invadens IP1]